MSSSEYRALFDRLDASGNGCISRSELNQGMSELNLQVDENKIDSFFNAIDIDGDGEISFHEFEVFITTHHPENSEKDVIFNKLNRMLPAIKHISKLTATELFNEESNTSFDLKIKSSSVPAFDDNQTSIRLQAGFEDGITDSEIGEGSSSLFYIKFACDNGADVASGLQEHVETLREFLGEMGEEVSMIIDTLNFETRQVADGAAIVVDLEDHPILGMYLAMAAGATGSVKQFKPSVLVEIASDKSLTDPDVTNGKGLLHVHVEAKSIVDALLNNQKTPVNAMINQKLNKAITKKMGIEVSTFLSLLNMESLKLELVMKDIQEGAISKQFSIKDTGSAFLNQMKGHPAFAIIGAMEFLKDAATLLKNNGVQSMTIGARTADVNVKLQLKADIWWALESIFEEEEE